MQSITYDNIEGIAQLLKITHTGDNETIKQASDSLQQLGTDLISFANSLIQIIKQENFDSILSHFFNIISSFFFL